MFILILLFNLLLIYLMFFPIIFLHELGHAFTARILGFKVFSVVMGYGKNLFEIEIFKIPIRLNLIPLQGLTMALPKTKRLFKTRTWFYVSGGLLVQVLLAFLCYSILGKNDFIHTIQPKSIFIQIAPITDFIYANSFLLFINIIPKKLNLPTGNAHTDGYRLLTIPFIKSKGLDELGLLFDELEAIECIRLEKFDEALEKYEEFQKLKPDNFLMNLNIGQIQLAKGNLEMARSMFIDVLERIETERANEKLDEKIYERFRYILYNNIAWTNIVYLREDLLEQADEYSRKALSSSPKFGAFLGTRGAVLIRKGQVNEGIHYLKRAYKYHSDNSARSAELLLIGIGEAKLGNKKQALLRLEQARKIHSKNYFFPIAEKEIIETINLTHKND